MNIAGFFDPRTVAVIGASPQTEKVGYALMQNLLRGKSRTIIPINPSYQEVLGFKCYSSVLEVKEKIDIALIAVRKDIVPQVLVECGKKSVPNAIVIAAGFGEMGEAGKTLEDEIKKIAGEYDMAVLGPNCLGVINAHADLNATFSADKPLKGGIAFLSQSGAIGTAMLDWTKKHGVGFSKFISLGNEAALTEIEFLEYLADDPDTRAVLLYLEKVTDGGKFMELSRRITASKPMVVLKAGRSEAGIAAVRSHTGALALEDAVFTAACKQAGIITVQFLHEMFDLAKLFQMGITKPVRRMVVLTNGGGPSVIAADAIGLSRSLEMMVLDDRTKDALRKVLPPMAAVSNPIDVVGDATASRYDDALKIITVEKNADAVVVMLTPQMMTDSVAIANVAAAYRKKVPIIPIFMGGDAVSGGVEALKQNGLINFEFPKDVIAALDALASVGASKQAKQTQRFSRPSVPVPTTMLDFAEMRTLLERYGIPIPGILVASKQEAAAAFGKFGGKPVAAKIVSPDISHKTDVGGVRTGLSNASEVEAAWDDISASVRQKLPQAKFGGLLIQPMIFGKETIIGMKRDRVFGPVLVFGLGGVFVEVLKDVAMRIAPVTYEDAFAMVEEIKGYTLLAGVRGEKAVDIAGLASLIVAVSKLSLEHLEIKELDLNPVIVDEKSTTVVDARAVVG